MWGRGSWRRAGQWGERRVGESAVWRRNFENALNLTIFKEKHHGLLLYNEIKWESPFLHFYLIFMALKSAVKLSFPVWLAVEPVLRYESQIMNGVSCGHGD